MGERMNFAGVRSIPRLFIPGASPEGMIALPKEEIDKFRKVLRLKDGEEIAILPNDGTLIRCRFRNVAAEPVEVLQVSTEPGREVGLALALPKGDRLDTMVRMGTEVGVRRFVLFPAIRSVAKWEPSKVGAKLRRFEAIAREAAEQSYRARLPEVRWLDSLSNVLEAEPHAIVLSEVEQEKQTLGERLKELGGAPTTLVVGPEGGWDPRELALIGERGATMGPLVYRTDTAAIVAASLAINQKQC